MAVDVRSELAGAVWQVLVSAGTPVHAGEDVIVLESMKMEVPVPAPCDGVIDEVLVAAGAPVEENEVLFRIEAG